MTHHKERKEKCVLKHAKCMTGLLVKSMCRCVVFQMGIWKRSFLKANVHATGKRFVTFRV